MGKAPFHVKCKKTCPNSLSMRRDMNRSFNILLCPGYVTCTLLEVPSLMFLKKEWLVLGIITVKTTVLSLRPRRSTYASSIKKGSPLSRGPDSVKVTCPQCKGGQSHYRDVQNPEWNLRSNHPLLRFDCHSSALHSFHNCADI